MIPAMMPRDEAAEARRRARAKWPIRVYRLGEEPPDDISEHTTAEERVAMVWPLTVEAWTLAGRTIPDYPRHRMPCRLIRRGASGDPPER